LQSAALDIQRLVNRWRESTCTLLSTSTSTSSFQTHVHRPARWRYRGHCGTSAPAACCLIRHIPRTSSSSRRPHRCRWRFQDKLSVIIIINNNNSLKMNSRPIRHLQLPTKNSRNHLKYETTAFYVFVNNFVQAFSRALLNTGIS